MQAQVARNHEASEATREVGAQMMQVPMYEVSAATYDVAPLAMAEAAPQTTVDFVPPHIMPETVSLTTADLLPQTMAGVTHAVAPQAIGPTAEFQPQTMAAFTS